ncbi:MAG: rod shape-determining protein RodA [Methylophilales bacterium RIFCSPHIGHO2_02_FULL_57_10]|nr:MAG: rod shape-determining protein RodA [Methylophilales bacterium RIFCSPHIGHO2_02_FULL_57_10]
MIKHWLSRTITHFDYFLLSMLLLVMLVALFVLYSASGQSVDQISRQIINLIAALGLMWLVTNISPQRLEGIAVPAYVLGLLLLIGVAFFGDVSHGARRWLNLGVARIQPSEGMKLAMPMMLAWYFARREATLRLSDYVVAALLLALPLGFILKQPDLGTTLLIGASGFYVLFLAGLSWRLMGGLAVTIGAMIPLLWPMLHDYQRKRVLILLDPSQDPLGAGYHTIQATIALGSGGLAGKGWLHGTQAQLDFLPERHTDFIFAVFGEEFGLLGIVLLMLLFLLIISRGLVIAANAQNMFCRLLAGSITLTFFTYAFVNMGMVSGILPVVGVPLPLISYGGTSLVTLLVGFGILMSIHTHKKLVAS